MRFTADFSHVPPDTGRTACSNVRCWRPSRWLASPPASWICLLACTPGIWAEALVPCRSVRCTRPRICRPRSLCWCGKIKKVDVILKFMYSMLTDGKCENWRYKTVWYTVLLNQILLHNILLIIVTTSICQGMRFNQQVY